VNDVKKRKEKKSDYLIDFCKCLNINWMAAGSIKLNGIFLLSLTFKMNLINYIASLNRLLDKESYRPSVLAMCCKSYKQIDALRFKTWSLLFYCNFTAFTRAISYYGH